MGIQGPRLGDVRAGCCHPRRPSDAKKGSGGLVAHVKGLHVRGSHRSRPRRIGRSRHTRVVEARKGGSPYRALGRAPVSREMYVGVCFEERLCCLTADWRGGLNGPVTTSDAPNPAFLGRRERGVRGGKERDASFSPLWAALGEQRASSWRRAGDSVGEEDSYLPQVPIRTYLPAVGYLFARTCNPGRHPCINQHGGKARAGHDERAPYLAALMWRRRR